MTQLDVANADPFKVHHWMSRFSGDNPDLPLSPLDQNDAKPRMRIVSRQTCHRDWSRHPFLDHSTGSKRPKCCSIDGSSDQRPVLLLDGVAGMHDAVGPTSVVRQQEKTGRILVQTSHRKHALGHRDQIKHGWLPVGGRARCHVSLWLVER